MELTVDIGAPVEIGESDRGSRRFIPITGGRFEGRGLAGEVIPGGADWQLTRPDGVLEVEAIYAIRTDDGQVIAVENRGIVVRDQTGAYVRTTPVFKAPRGPYEWLNRRAFAGTITVTSQGTQVVVRVFEIQ